MKVRYLVSSVDTLNEAIATVYIACQVFFNLKANFIWFTALHFHVYSTTMKEKDNFECVFRNNKQNAVYVYSGLTIELVDFWGVNALLSQNIEIHHTFFQSV